jgi:hypothetical protein
VTNNPALDDQVQAATAHTTAAFTDVAALTGHGIDGLPRTGPTADAWRRWAATPVNACPHLANPAPAFAFLALPGFMACPRCTDLLTAKYRQDVPEDACDVCLTEPPDGQFKELLMTMGPLLITANVCRNCDPRQG